MQSLKSSVLSQTEQLNCVIVYKNAESNLENKLSGERLIRYEEANRQVTKDKLLSGSHFVYRCLKYLGFEEVLCQEAFSAASSYLIKLPQGSLSYSNSGDYHILSYSPNGQTGVDIEEYKDRAHRTYQRFLDLTDNKVKDEKLQFYKKWLEKEIFFKCSQVEEITYFTLDTYICGYGFNNQNKIKTLAFPSLVREDVEELSILTI